MYPAANLCKKIKIPKHFYKKILKKTKYCYSEGLIMLFLYKKKRLIHKLYWRIIMIL